MKSSVICLLSELRYRNDLNCKVRKHEKLGVKCELRHFKTHSNTFIELKKNKIKFDNSENFSKEKKIDMNPT